MSKTVGLNPLPAQPAMRGRALLLLLSVLVIGGVAAALAIRANRPRAEVGAGFMARVVCACRYVGNRDMASCKGDAEPGMEIVTVTDDPASKTITATVPLLAKRTARYSPAADGLETGCTLLD